MPNGSVTLAHVVSAVNLYGDGLLGISDEIVAAQRAGGEAILREVMATLEPVLPVPSTLNLHGPVAETLADTALHGGFDLLVVGTKGRGAVSRVLLGSVADRLVHICQVPVLVVR